MNSEEALNPTGGRGHGGTLQSFTRVGSVSRSNPLLKVPLSYTFY